MNDEKKIDKISEFNNLFYLGKVINFIIKTFIVSVAIIFSVRAILPEFPKIPETERNKLLLLSLVQNPYILWKISLIEEDNGNLKKSILYTETAIGLLEMHGASEKYLKKYYERLADLKNKIN